MPVDKDRLQSEELYRAMSEYFSTLLDVFNDIVQRESLPQREYKEVVSLDGYRPQVETKQRPDYQRIGYGFENWDVVQGYDDVISTLQELAGEYSGKEVIHSNILQPFLTEYLQITKDIEFDEDNFITVFFDLEKYLDDPVTKQRTWSTLYNFEMEREALELNEEIRIRAISDEERNELATLVHEPDFQISPQTPSDDFVIEYEFENVEGDMEMREEKIEATVLALRLFNPTADVRYQTTISEPTSEFGGLPFSRAFSEGEPRRLIMEDKFSLDADDAEEFKEFWNDHFDLIEDSPGGLRPAFKRYTDAVHRDDENDTLLDLVLSMEIPLSNGGGYYKMAERTSLLIAADFQERVTVKKQVKEAASERSKIVHGSSTNASNDLIQTTYQIASRALKKFIQLKKEDRSDEEIRDSIDELALKGPGLEEHLRG